MTDTLLDLATAPAPAPASGPVRPTRSAAATMRPVAGPLAHVGTVPPAHRPDAARDRLAIATLMGVASRHASRRDVAFEDAATEVRRAAGGRGDLLGEAAGVFAAMGRADAAAWYANAAAHLCIAADGDPEIARRQVDTVTARLSAPRRGVAGGPPVRVGGNGR